MAPVLGLLENEAKVKSIIRNNNLLEKKFSSFQRQCRDLSRNHALLDSCCSQVKHSATAAEEMSVSDKDVKNHQKKLHSFLAQSTDQVNSTIDKMDFFCSKGNHSLPMEMSVLSITLPYEACIEKSAKKHETMVFSIDEVSSAVQHLENEKVDVEKRQSSTGKLIFQTEKEIMKLKEEIQVNTNLESNIIQLSLEKLSSVKDSSTSENVYKAKLEEEINEARQIYEDALKQDVISQESAMMTQQLESLNELCSDLSDLNKINLTSIEKFPDCNEVCELSDELQTLEKSEAENSESIINLEASLEDIKYQNKKVRKSFDQINQLENAYIVKKEVLTRKKSAIEDVKRQIAESKITLNKLKVTVRAVERSDTPENVESKKEEAFRRLVASSTELPGPESFQRDNVRNVEKSLRFKKWNQRTTSQSSFTSDSTRSIGPIGVHYPGIKLINKDAATPTEVIRKITSELNESATSEDSTFDDDTGTTQDESGLNAFFNSPVSKEQTSMRPQFSMIAHMEKYDTMQAKKNMDKLPDNVRRESEMEHISHNYGRPSEVNRPASVSSKRHDPAASISATSEESILSGTTQDESMLNDFFNPTGTDEKLNDVEFSMTAHVAEFDNRQKAKRAAEQIKKSSSKISGKKEESVADDKSGSGNSYVAESEAGFSQGSEENESMDDEDLVAPDDGGLDQTIWDGDD
ncbi:Protein MRVI1 [Caenorhabditis elegans]|uniref:Protein MRVI1 n=1 Tax=Caenorhabditis elegans TaxID=6239 RepID=A0A7R9SUL5_CAEEL|nr:Protein MRVI1 [Caenorhabditis elegans]CAD8107993.1 Protein MRVI1 [Caenorhabditis elegans]